MSIAARSVAASCPYLRSVACTPVSAANGGKLRREEAVKLADLQGPEASAQ